MTNVSETRAPVAGAAAASTGAGSFQGHLPRHRARHVADTAEEQLEGRWFANSRYRRRARVTKVEALTTTGTMRIGFEVVDGEPFDFQPGQFVGIEHKFKAGYRRSPYCMVSAPTDRPVFDLLIRVVPDGPLSLYLGAIRVGDEIAFRGPTGRSMLPKPDGYHQHVLLATGTGVAPFVSLVQHLLAGGFEQPIHLWWGLRSLADVCLRDELDAMAASHPNFEYDISLSDPPPGWTGLVGRLTASVPPLLEGLDDRRFYLAGNGAMIEDMTQALSDLGVVQKLTYKEPFFNTRYQADRRGIAAIVDRFVACDLARAQAHPGEPTDDVDTVLHDPVSHGPSELFDLVPTLISG